MTRKLIILLALLALAVASCGGSDDGGSDDGDSGSQAAPVNVGPGDSGNGLAIYDRTCVACHGPAGEGITGLGKPMPGSAFIGSLNDAELIGFIKEGRGPGHPDNTTGIDMPAKGGDDSLTDQDLADVVAYIRTLS